MGGNGGAVANGNGSSHNGLRLGRLGGKSRGTTGGGGAR